MTGTGVTPTVSVVVPCYNVAGHVADAVESAVAQAHAALEILCVDDGSTDETPAVLRRLAEAHPTRVRVIHQPNGGACAARNRGLAEAQGAWVQFLDADDVLHPDKLAHQLALVARADAEGRAADLVAGSYGYEHLDGRRDEHLAGEFSVWVNFVDRRLGITSANLWRAEAVRAAGGWDPARPSSQEYELILRMLRRGAAVVYDRTPLTTIRQRAGSISTTNMSETMEHSIRLRGEVIRRLIAEGRLDGPELRLALSALLQRLRYLYPLNPDLAAALHRDWVPRGFWPGRLSRASRAYALLYYLLGFGPAERFTRWVRATRASSAPAPLPK